MKYRVVFGSHIDQTHLSRDVSFPRTYIISHDSYMGTTIQFPDSNFKKTYLAYLGSLYIYILTCPLSPPIMHNTRCWWSLTGSEAKAKLGPFPMGLDATLYHYVSYPIILSPPSHPFLPSSILSPYTHRLRRSLPLPSNSCPPSHTNPLFIITPGPYPIFLARTFIFNHTN